MSIEACALFNVLLLSACFLCALFSINTITAMFKTTLGVIKSRTNSAELISEMSQAFDKAKVAQTPQEKQDAAPKIARLIKRLD